MGGKLITERHPQRAMIDLSDLKKKAEKIPTFHTKIKVQEQEDSNMLCCNPAVVD